MTNQEILIEPGDDTEGHGAYRAVVEGQGTEWLQDKLGGAKRFRLLPDDTGDDTEGQALRGTLVRVMVADEDDVEGHAIALRFPSRADADDFRRRVVVGGALVATVALGAAGGVALSSAQSGADAAGAGVAIDQASTQRLDELAATTQSGPADQASTQRLDEMAATTQSGAAATTSNAARDASTQRLDEMAATTQSGAAATTSSDASTQRLDEMAATTQSAEQSSTQRLDEMAATTQSGPAADDEETGTQNEIGGPTPRGPRTRRFEPGAGRSSPRFS